MQDEWLEKYPLKKLDVNDRMYYTDNPNPIQLSDVTNAVPNVPSAYSVSDALNNVGSFVSNKFAEGSQATSEGLQGARVAFSETIYDSATNLAANASDNASNLASVASEKASNLALAASENASNLALAATELASSLSKQASNISLTIAESAKEGYNNVKTYVGIPEEPKSLLTTIQTEKTEEEKKR